MAYGNKGGKRGNPDGYNQRRKEAGSRRDNRREFSHEGDTPENIIIGRNAVKELLSSGRDIDKIYITSGEREGSINLLLGIAAERGIPITECDRTRLDSIAAGGRHQGIIAVAAEHN